MKAYGLPRFRNIEYPDVVDIRNFGLKTSTGRVFKDRDDHGHSRPKTRRLARLQQHKFERCNAKKQIRDEVLTF